MSDYEITPDEQAQVEAAAGAVHYWRGKALEPFSFGRESAWRRLGYHEVEDNMESSVAIIYLCLQAPADLNRVRGGELSPFRLKIEQWADEQGVTMNNAAGREAVALGTEIWMDTKQAQFMPVTKSDGKGPDPNAQPRAS